MKKTCRVVNESTGEEFTTYTLSCAQSYRDRRDYEDEDKSAEFVAVYGVESGSLLAESACRSVFRRTLPSVPTVSTEELKAVLDNVQITDSFGFGGEVVLRRAS